MSREIKFRMYLPGVEKLTYTHTIPELIEIYKSVTGFSKDIVYEQYTGLKDKNGKEIYEGDILMHTGTNQCDLEVHYKNGAFWGKGVFTDCIMDMYLNSYDFKSIEIIGNIHDNYELLKGDQQNG